MTDGTPEVPQDQQTPQDPQEQEVEIKVGGEAEVADTPPPTDSLEPIRHPDLSDNMKDSTTAADLLNEIIAMKEDDFIPWEEVTLPSRGIYYGDKLPGGVCRVRAMGIHAEKILATQRLAQTGQSIDHLFKHCIQLTDEMDPLDLLSGDRVFLLYVLRGLTHGNNYEFSIKCPSCEFTSIQAYDLNELAGTQTFGDESLGSEPFQVPLPYMSEVIGREVWVKIRFMRGKDVSTLTNKQKFKKRITHSNRRRQGRAIAIDETITENLSLIIRGFGGEGVDGEVGSRDKIASLVDRMHARDTAVIREFLRKHSPGIDTMIRVECPECGSDYQTDLPITESFFRPASTGESG